ncbi:MAG: VOC family protein [Acidimicrobiia bacterium]
MTTTTRPRQPRFNHVAMSMPAELLGPESRAEITRFYDEVFGWQELPQMTEDGRRLVLSCYTVEQFVFLIAEDEPMQCPRLDHFGISVATEAELDDVLARAKAFRAHDDRVDIIDKLVDDHGMLAITSIYIRFVLPMMVEVQWWDFKDTSVASTD